MPDEPKPTEPVHLPVLPNSGKADELRAAANGGTPTGDNVPQTTDQSAIRNPQSAMPYVPNPNPGTPPPPPGHKNRIAPNPEHLKTVEQRLLEGKIIGALKKVYDPEIPVDIYELGLIYDIEIDAEKNVHIRMTLTAPGCPVAGILPGHVEQRVEAIEEIKSCKVELVWDPPWDQSMMSEVALLQLGMC